MEFGLANDQPDLRAFCGPVQYAALEIFTGGRYTTAVDIWSLGVIVLETCITFRCSTNNTHNQRIRDKGTGPGLVPSSGRARQGLGLGSLNRSPHSRNAEDEGARWGFSTSRPRAGEGPHRRGRGLLKRSKDTVLQYHKEHPEAPQPPKELTKQDDEAFDDSESYYQITIRRWPQGGKKRGKERPRSR